MTFDYFYGAQADLFTFYRIPKSLFTDSRFATLSSDAKVLYGLMLDRMGLSAKNGWQDEHGRVYIVFSVEEVCQAMSVSNKTACKYLAELDAVKGIGLIERVRLGLGQKSRIYVRNFNSVVNTPTQQNLLFSDGDTLVGDSANAPLQTQEDAYHGKELPAEKENVERPLLEVNRPLLSRPLKVHFKKCKNYTSRSVKTTLQEIPPKTGTFQKCKYYTSRSVKSTSLEMYKVHGINDTNISDNKYNNTTLTISPISLSSLGDISTPARDRKTDLTAHVYESIRADVMDQIGADTLKEEYGEVVEELVELITDVAITPMATMRVAGADRPIEILRLQFARLTLEHVEAAIRNLRKHGAGHISDIKAYMRTLLFNELFSMETRMEAKTW